MFAVQCGLARCLDASPSSRHATYSECSPSIDSVEGRVNNLAPRDGLAVNWMSMKTTSMPLIQWRLASRCSTFESNRRRATVERIIKEE